MNNRWYSKFFIGLLICIILLSQVGNSAKATTIKKTLASVASEGKRQNEYPVIPNISPVRSDAAITSYAMNNIPYDTWTLLGFADQGVYSAVFSPNYFSDHTFFFSTYSDLGIPRHTYRSTDGGNSWNPVLDLVLGDLNISPNFSSDHTVFGRGDSIITGIYRTTDGGDNWKVVGLVGIYQTALAISPTYQTDKTIFSGGDDGTVYRSIDQGNTWASVTNRAGFQVRGIAISPNFATDRTVYAGFGVDWDWTNGGVYKSNDGGNTWIPMNNGLDYQEVHDLIISPSFPKDHTLFVVMWTGGIYKTTDGGSTWGNCYQLGRGESLAISPDYATDRTIYSGSWGGPVVKSIDGGVTWTEIPGVSGYYHNISVTVNQYGSHTLLAGGEYSTTHGLFMYIESPVKKPWTLMYYLDGDTTFSDEKPLDRDYSIPIIYELRKAAPNPAINIVSLLDKYGNNNSAYYLINSATDPLKPSSLTQNFDYWPQGEVNMGDPQTLSDYVTWAESNFPADHYALILSDHGQGLGGGMFDITSGNDKLTVMEMGNALNTITNNGTNKIDILYMDACLMGMLEDAYQFRNYIDYYVSSENVKQGYIVPHGQAISSISKSTLPKDLANLFASTFTSYGATKDKLYTMAVMDMTQINPVLDATILLAQRINSVMSTNFQNLSDVLQHVQRFDYDGNDVIDTTDDSIDLFDFAVLVKGWYSDADIKASAQAVMDAIGNFVVLAGHQDPGKVWGVGNSHGVAIYFPSRPSSFYSSINYDFAQGVIWSILGNQKLSKPPSEVQVDDSISWGNMLVNYIVLTNPTGEDIPIPPDPLPQPITTYAISGNAGVGGATIEYTGGSTVTNKDGVYSFVVPSGWSGTVTPSMTEYVFSPENLTYNNVQDGQPEQDYTASLNTYLLSVSNIGTGSGTVTSFPDGINCGLTCSYAFSYNTVVTLTATPTAPSGFGGWSGGGCSGRRTCTVTVGAAQSITATFIAFGDQTLTVNKVGLGSGEVTSVPAGINCGSTCSYDFAYQTIVTLMATPASASLFGGWSGGECFGIGTCTLTMSAAQTITANFKRILFAKPISSGTGDCLSWENACILQNALTQSVSGDEIWAAAGTYKPTTVETDRAASFKLIDGLSVYGGFVGTEIERDQRNPTVNVTILSGDIDNNDSQTPIITDLNTVIGNTTNSINVVVSISNYGSGATLDGFTITAGYGVTNFGGGMYNNKSEPMLANVTFIGNSARSGGGMYNDSAYPTLTNVTFSGNSASFGGGIYTYSVGISLTDVTFNGNSAQEGGGMWNSSSSPTLLNVTFNGNSAQEGGGMINKNSNADLTNVTFNGNSAQEGGGMFNQNSYPDLANVTFSGNTAKTFGGGIYNTMASSSTLRGVTMNNNVADGYGGGIADDSSSDSTLRESILWGNKAGSAGSQYYYGGNPNNPYFEDSIVQDGCPTGITCTNIITADPILGQLGNYGGFTQTIPLLTGSSAIDTGRNKYCSTITDQRGVMRPQGAQCDIGAFEVDNTSPIVVSNVRANASPTNAASVDFTVTFSESVINVDVTDFTLLTTGISGAAVSGVSGSGSVYTVRINTGSGSGTLSLDVPASATISDLALNLLASLPYTSGQMYAIDKTAPIVFSSVRTDDNPTNSLSVDFTVTFSEAVSGVDLTDFTLLTSGISGAAVSGVSGSGSVYTITVITGTGSGTLRLDVPVGAIMADLAGNPLGSLPYTSGDNYVADKVPPIVNTFTVTTSSNTLNIPIIAFSASDDMIVTSYLVTTSITPPSAMATGWTGTLPATYSVFSDGSYTLYPWVKDAAGNVSTAFDNPPSVVVDTTAPMIVSSTCVESSLTNTDSVDFTVTFSESVMGVDAADFSLMTSGLSGAVVIKVSGSGSIYTVTVKTGSGNGTIRLDVPFSTTITDLAGNALAGLPYTGGQTCTIIKAYTIFLPLTHR